ncbi:uncharacterized protein LOC110276559 [Arachis duranensis]|uniref:Uncharacterized protein LOC110276559 n=1 Tax=Arachis duranensis TaxID=130453 RepID=A0A6P5MVG4_ARADU|nr:uncharacterized protein LOC110276559 [Arachis duranensis]
MDKSKHCAFHQKFFHTIDECVVAKDLLERLVRQGLLDKYISTRSRKEATKDINKPRYDSDHKEKGTWRGPIETPTSKGVINYISGSFAAGGGLTNTTPNLDDLVVISVHMGELTVKKVLLDPGSSVDVLFYSTFKKMQLSDKALQPS